VQSRSPSEPYEVDLGEGLRTPGDVAECESDQPVSVDQSGSCEGGLELADRRQALLYGCAQHAASAPVVRRPGGSIDN
jgi:hypothetical protein